ncbi:MAG: methyl-accepting chemotaxis protein [Myxococcota bacterium]|nr:methyl-accepting chemotaxis protein [Myxococcota bacterium]
MTASTRLSLAIQLRSGIIQVGAAGLALVYLSMLLSLDSAQWVELGWALLLITIISAVVHPLNQGPIVRPVSQAAEILHQEEPDPELARIGLAGATALPFKLAVSGVVGWVIASLLVPLWMWLRLEAVPLAVLTGIASAAIAAGLLSTVACYFAVKRQVEPLLDRCAFAVGDPAERAKLVYHVPIATKLAVTSTSIVLVSLFFVIQLAWAETSRPLEAHVVEVQQRYLGALAKRLSVAPESRPVIDLARTEMRELGIASELFVLDAGEAAEEVGDVPLLDVRDLAHLRASGKTGDSRAILSDQVYAWTAIGSEGALLVAAIPASAMSTGLTKSRARYGGVLIAALLASFAVSILMSSDISRSLAQFRKRAARVADGDLGQARLLESDDEMGDTGREVERMILSLRDTIDRVTQTALVVDSGAVALSELGGGIRDASRSQTEALGEAAREVASIDRDIGGIKDSAHALTGNVEEASSSILELGAAGEELNHTASALSKQIEDVSTSIEQMIISSRQIGENTEGLAGEVGETSASMTQMAASLRSVDEGANETASLSEQVSQLAGRGQDRVSKTIEGMAAIRDATDTVSETIAGLGARIQEIGAIVDVIDDVADETNLLALNAAIIAAQAGDQGRAFSVVADEIKDLADRVLRSTKEIAALIRAVQSESGNAGEAIARGSESVQRGVELAAEAGVSLEEITTAAGTSRERIQEIVVAVRDQSKASTHVVGLMERVNQRVDEIRRAGAEQERGNEVIMRGSLMMRDVAQQTHRTTEEQARGARQVRQSIEGIQEAVEQIHRSLEGQSGASRSAVSSLQQVHEKTASNHEATDQMSQATEGLREQAQTLRDDVGRFRVE